MSWLETYRGTVYRWEVDHNDHLTVAYYFTRLADAGLGPAYAERTGRACATADCYVRYTRELRVGDIMHVESGVIGVEPDALLLGHKVFNSESGALCTTAEQRVHHVELANRKPVALYAEQRHAAEQHRVQWDGPPRERRPRPRGLEGFRQTARDTAKPSELDVFGQSGTRPDLYHYTGIDPDHIVNAALLALTLAGSGGRGQ